MVDRPHRYNGAVVMVAVTCATVVSKVMFVDLGAIRGLASTGHLLWRGRHEGHAPFNFALTAAQIEELPGHVVAHAFHGVKVL